MVNTIPVYIIAGMLESGKTTFIKDTIASDDFYKKGKTLVLVTEFGEEEYEQEFLDKYNTVVREFESQTDFSALNIMQAVNEVKPDRVVIELNGMYDIATIEFPSIFKLYQFINFIDYNTFPTYFMNMRQKYLDVIKQSNVVIFINIKEEEKEKLEQYSPTFKLTNGNAQFMIMDKNGRLFDAFKIELPYDLNADVIRINDEDYGVFYIDSLENKADYEGKVIDIDVMVVKSKTLPKNTFVAGRLAMTCCSNDIQLYGQLCHEGKEKLKDRCWINLVAKIKIEYSKEYDQEECVLYPISIKKIPPLANQVLDLTQ